jgi:hypothetical protein
VSLKFGVKIRDRSCRSSRSTTSLPKLGAHRRRLRAPARRRMATRRSSFGDGRARLGSPDRPECLGTHAAGRLS